MSTIPYFTPLPPFQTQEILSATRLNQMLGNLDALYGIDQRPVMGQVYGRSSEFYRDWTGWVAFNGDQLMLYLPTPTYQTGIIVVFDNTEKVHKHVTVVPFGTPAGVQRIPIPLDVGYKRFQVYQVYVQGNPPFYAFMNNSQDDAIPAMPAFTNGATSSNADLNAIIDATAELGEQFSQPQISGTRWMTPNWLNDNTPGTIKFYAPYRNTWFEFYLTAKSSEYVLPFEGDLLIWRVIDDTATWKTFWGLRLLRDSSNSPTASVRVKLDDFASLTVGQWYHFQFLHSMNDPKHQDGVTRLYWYNLQQFNTESWTPTKRWTVGDVVNGSTGDAPRLDTMSDNLAYLNTRRDPINMVMRQSTQRRDDNNLGNYNTPTFARRIYRWLAYESAAYDDPATPGDETKAALFYAVGKPNIFTSITLTQSTTTVFLDLDTTPIKPGMIFYAFNCNYAIQVPDYPSEYP